MKILVEILNRQRKIKLSSKRLTTVARQIIRYLYQSKKLSKFQFEKNQILTISILLIGKERMKEINFKYRGKKYVTDVLSFSYLEKVSLSEEIYLGEILINPEKAKIQARQYGVSLWQEITRLLVHGVLHLFGYDHEVSHKEARKMRKLEQKILSNLKS